MRFVRVTVSHTQNKVVGVAVQDLPFFSEHAGKWHCDGEECETYDLGCVEDQEWLDENGQPCTPCRHIMHRLETDDPMIAKIHDVPCTLEGIKQRLREKGLAGVHVKVRAWLANVLPPHHVDAMGIGRNLPISAMKAAEALRNKRDPHGGSRMLVLERQAQQRSDARSRARLRKQASA